MATAIKAIPTLYGADAERFLAAAEAAEQRYNARTHSSLANNTAVQQARQIWANMIH